MSLLMREWETKLALIASITRSQEALARMLGSVADCAEHSPDMAKLIRENIRILSGVQGVLTEAVTGVKLKKPSYGKPGKPGKPWLRDLTLSASTVVEQDRQRPGRCKY